MIKIQIGCLVLTELIFLSGSYLYATLDSERFGLLVLILCLLLHFAVLCTYFRFVEKLERPKETQVEQADSEHIYTTKYSCQDLVWFMHENAPRFGSPDSIFIFKSDKKCEVSYKFRGILGSIPESKVFKSRSELLANL